MVKGLDVFLAHFRSFNDRFVLIGGTACDMALTEAGLEFRATKDLDIVIWVEALDEPFVKAFWEFVRTGKYQIQRKSTGERQFYRFQKPEDRDYQIITPLEEPPPAQVRQDLSDFIAKVKDEGVDLKALKVSGTLPELYDGLAKAYHCEA